MGNVNDLKLCSLQRWLKNLSRHVPSQRYITADSGATWKHFGEEEGQHKREPCPGHTSQRRWEHSKESYAVLLKLLLKSRTGEPESSSQLQ